MARYIPKNRLGSPKTPRGIYDFVGEDRKTRAWREGPSTLVILPMKDNPIDNIFVAFNLEHGYHMDPKRLMNWWVIGENKGKRVAGRIKDIYMSRDLLVKQSDGKVSLISFEDVKYLKPNPA